MNKIITIGREFGSGGRQLGLKLAEILGIRYYDKEIITEIAKRTDLSEEYVHDTVGRRPVFSYPVHVGRTFTSVNTLQVMESGALFNEQCKLLKEFADKSDCIIVGRCADYILKDYGPFKIFVYADMASKIARCRNYEEGEQKTDKELKRLIKRIERNRAENYRFYTSLKWGDKLNYDMCVNTTNGDIDKIAMSIAKLLQVDNK